MGLFLLAFVAAGMLFVFPRAIQAKEPCPHDINPDDSAWVLREVTEKSAMKNGLDDSYTRWIRVFAYQPDPVKRFRKEFHPTCFAEVHSFVVGGYEKWVAKRIRWYGGVRVLVLQIPKDIWVEGSLLNILAEAENPSNPSYHIFLYNEDNREAAHIVIPLPPIFPRPTAQSSR